MILYYIRHGEPIYSPDSLTPLGERQADALALRLANSNIGKIYSSTSIRAQMTAKPTADILGKPITLLDWADEKHAWRELTVRRSDGFLHWCFQDEYIAELFQSKEIRRLDNRWYEHPEFADTRFKAGIQRIEREVYAFMETLGYRHDSERGGYIPIRPNNERVAFFAHQGFGFAFLSALLDIPYPVISTKTDMTHTGVTVISFEGTRGLVIPKVLTLSNDSHLFKANLPLKYNNKINI